jgi:DNA-binding PucR family transcriptional regulator
LRRSHPTDALIGIVEGDVVAVISGGVPAVPRGYCAGIAGPAPLLELHGPFGDASRALHTAWNFRQTGSHRLEELGLLPSVILDRRLGELLTRRFLTPLGSEQEQERICHTLETLFACDMQIAAAAEALYVHENTVRKRLRVAEERAGINLKRIDDLAAVWWALMHRRAGLAARPPQTAQSGVT